MNPKHLPRTRKRLLWLLRHGANEMQLPMDAAGWVQRDAVLCVLGISDGALDRVMHDDASPIQQMGRFIRASHGHTLRSTPVTQDALEKSWRPWTCTKRLWHGANLMAVKGVGVHGILPQGRSHVQLAKGLEGPNVEPRAAVMLTVCPRRLAAAGLKRFLVQNDVLVREVPVSCIVGVVLCSSRAQRSASQVRAWLGIDGPS